MNLKIAATKNHIWLLVICVIFTVEIHKNKVAPQKNGIFQLRGWSVLSFSISKLIPEKLGGAAHKIS